MMNPAITQEQTRMVFATMLSSVAAVISPIQGLFTMLLIMFGFNIFCGMRADGVSIIRCRRFSFSKFKNAAFEILLYISIISVLYFSMERAGDKEEGIIVSKILSYIFSYVYLQNSFKNLVRAYPKNRAYRMIYHFIRFEFAKMLPSRIGEVIDRISRELDKEEKEKENG